MNRKLSLWGLLVVGAVALSACAAPAAGNGGAAQGAASPAATMAKAMPTEAKVMATETPMAEKMEDKTMATPDKMMEEKAMATETPMAEKMEDKAAMPAWFSAPLTDVNTGETFTVADLKGKVTLVETMAIWCPTCLRQQREVLKLKELLGERDDFATVTLDVDANEEAAALKAYAAQHGFGGRYAVAGAAVAREIAMLYGDQFINPPSAPMLVIDRQGMAHPLPFGVKDAATLQAALAPFLAEGM